MKKSDASEGLSPSALITKKIDDLGGWRRETLERMRKLIKDADPDVVQEWKWMGTTVFLRDCIICTSESYQDEVKLTFAKGALQDDLAHLFNSSRDGNVGHAINIHDVKKLTHPPLGRSFD